MFDWAKHGPIEKHHYRSFYDAQPYSTTHCAFCNRVIRFCYALHDQNNKTFVIGTCDFYHYKGTETYTALKAARVLQQSLLGERKHDTALYGFKAKVLEVRKVWARARRKALKLTSDYRKAHGGDWLPKPLFDLRQEAKKLPPAYKRQGLLVRWYEIQAAKITALTTNESI